MYPPVGLIDKVSALVTPITGFTGGFIKRSVVTTFKYQRVSANSAQTIHMEFLPAWNFLRVRLGTDEFHVLGNACVLHLRYNAAFRSQYLRKSVSRNCSKKLLWGHIRDTARKAEKKIEEIQDV
jgi:hypothetical protein